jgi:lysophospholipase L1-like esterase
MIIMTRILAFGASVVAGFWDSKGGWVQRLKTDLHEISKSSGDKHYQVYNLGVSGHTSEMLLSRIKNEIKARKDDENHDLVILISIGGNDCLYDSRKGDYRVPKDEFIANFRELMDIAKGHATEVYYIGGQPVNPDQVNQDTMLDRHHLDTEARKEYFRTARKICKEKEVNTIDISEKVKERKFRSKLFDGLHPNTEGHQKIYEVVREHLKEESSLKISKQ